MIEFKIEIVYNPRAHKYNGIFMPKESIADCNGMWYCDNFRILSPADALRKILADNNCPADIKIKRVSKIVGGLNRMLRRTQGNRAHQIGATTYENILREVKQHQCQNGVLIMECLEIHRKQVFSNHVAYFIDFIIKQAEINEILRVAYKYNLKPETVPKAKCHKTVIVQKGSHISFAKVPAVSDRDARRVSQNPDGRGIKEFMPDAQVGGLPRHTPTTYTIETGNYYDLESGHSKKYRKTVKKFAKPNAEQPARKGKAIPADMYIDIYSKNNGIKYTAEKPKTPRDRMKAMMEQAAAYDAMIRQHKQEKSKGISK